MTELRRKTSDVINQAQAGRTVEITDRGRVVLEVQARRPGLSGAEFARLWRARRPMGEEAAAEVLANIRATEKAE